MTLQKLVDEMIAGGTTSTALSCAREAVLEVRRARDGMKAAYPLRVRDGKMDAADAEVKIRNMENAVKICECFFSTLADAVKENVK